MAHYLSGEAPNKGLQKGGRREGGKKKRRGVLIGYTHAAMVFTPVFFFSCVEKSVLHQRGLYGNATFPWDRTLACARMFCRMYRSSASACALTAEVLSTARARRTDCSASMRQTGEPSSWQAWALAR